jgi:hypothetical protein
MTASQVSAPVLTVAADQTPHYELIKTVFPPALVNATPALRQTLRGTKPVIPPWYEAATQEQKDQLKTCVDASLKSHTELEQAMSNLQDIDTFGEPLLVAALKAAGYELDVHTTCLRLYVPDTETFGVRTGYRTRTLSLMQAALNNFEANEAQAGFFNHLSGFITAPDARGHFERHATTLKIETFAQLCRDLDLGQQYQDHLSRYLLPRDTVSKNLLRERFITRHKDAFKAAAYRALLKGDITGVDHALLVRVAAGERRIKAGKKQLWYRRPALMNLELHGCVIIEACEEHRLSTWLLAYIPDHPDHPIKRYESFADFEEETTRELTAYKPEDLFDSRGVPVTAHQRFIAGFVAKKSLAYYYRRFTETRLDEPENSLALSADPDWREYWARRSRLDQSAYNKLIKHPHHISRTPQRNPNLNVDSYLIKGLWVDFDLWEELYTDMRKQAVDDALSMAVPTAVIDAASHEHRMANLMNIGLFVLNMISMVIPPLGVAMAVVTAGQLLYEVYEGVVDLSEGDREAGWAHLNNVLDSVAQLALGGAALHVTVSPFVAGLKAVELPSGKARLWKPDLTPYALESPLPAGSVPDAEGVHTVNGRQILPLEGSQYALRSDEASGTYRIEHPHRPGAYEPQIENNGSGAWLHEADQPQTWDGTPLMRRLGHAMDGLSDTQLEQVRRVSDVDEDVLRRLHVENEPTPALLIDTAQRFRAYANAEGLSGQILAGPVSAEMSSYSASLMVEMPGWPANQVIEVFEGAGQSRMAVKYGDLGKPGASLISISRADLISGKLPERVVAALSEEQLKGLLGQHLPDETGLRSQRLQARLGDYAKNNHQRIFDSLYKSPQLPKSVELQVMERDFKSLPTRIAQELLDGATPKQRAALINSRKIPLELAQQARQALRQLRLARAYEGLYLDVLVSADTEALVVNTLEHLPGWEGNVRLEVREESVGGRLRASCGVPEATDKKVLVRVGDGQYQAFDAEGNELHGVDTLYGAMQHALTDAHRRSLGLPHVGQGPQLRVMIQDHALSRPALRTVLKMQQGRPFFKPPSKLPGGRRGYPLSGRGSWALEREINVRIRTLYPDITPAEIAELRASARNPLNDAWLKSLEREFDALTGVLRRWQISARDGAATTSPSATANYLARGRIVRDIGAAWSRTGPRHFDGNGQYLGQAIEWHGVELRQQLRTLPPLPADFDHVSKLSLRDMDMNSEDIDGFVSNFSGLSSVSVEACRLTRLPPAIGNQPHLTRLYLGGNDIVLDPHGVALLSKLTRLEVLSLESNPLGLSPDLSHMPNLRQIWLADTGLQEWPTGVFRLPRPRRLILDLQENPLTRVPVFAPGSDNAGIVARTSLSRERLSDEGLSQFRLYIEAAGNDPDRIFPPKRQADSGLWKAGLTEEEWQSKQRLWEMLEDSIGSEAFFNEIRALARSGDASAAGGRYLPELTGKVWRMIEAMGEDAELRDELFRMAVAPTACVDAGAQLFNAMGVEVLLNSAYASENIDAVKRSVFRLARGKWRLDELGRIAHERVAELVEQGVRYPERNEQGGPVIHYDNEGNEVADIDEVEIYLAYTAGLSTRLDLPWQARTMLYREDYVTPAMVEAAYERVTALDQGEQLRTNMIEQPMWSDFLLRTNKAEYARIAEKFEALINYEEAQTQWARGGLSEVSKQRLRDTIDRTANILDRSRSDSLPGTVMTQVEYDASVVSINNELNTLNMRLTDDAISLILGA